MADPQRSATSKANDKGAGDHISELWELLRAYAEQETVDPLKSLGRFLAFGLAGAVTGGIGATLMVIGLLRVLQTETGTALTGSWNWVPYVVGMVVCAGLMGAAMLAIRGKSDKRGS